MNLSETDLIVDEVYGGSREGNAADDPLPQLLGVDNGAGFRHLGKRPKTSTLNLLVLKSNFNDTDWPDSLDKETGLLTYYGDNKKAGDIHNTPRQGNLILRNLFDSCHSQTKLTHFPPIFVFGGMGKGSYRDVRFLGLAVPGAKQLEHDEDLIALWKSSGSDKIRFQNYKATFTILDVNTITRKWIIDIQSGNAISSNHAPKVWLDWVKNRQYKPLEAPKTIDIRKKIEQQPQTKADCKIIELIYNHYKNDSYGFEYCAKTIAELLIPQINHCELTRPTKDGGRDAIGIYRIGTEESAIDIEFALEAKCYNIDAGVGVKDTSRLISRIRHRQFGIIVTTSYIAEQAYKEIKEDKQPIIIISAIDIVNILKRRIGSYKNIQQWLKNLG